MLNHLSHVAFENKCQNFRTLHDANYHDLRRVYSLGSQAVISAEKEVVARYKGIHANMAKTTAGRTSFVSANTPLRWSAKPDYSLKVVDGQFVASLQSLNGRIKNIPVEGLELLHDENLRIGTATHELPSRQMVVTCSLSHVRFLQRPWTTCATS